MREWCRIRHQGRLAPPNRSVEPTCLRQAAHLKRWAPRFRRQSAASGANSSRTARSAQNSLMPCQASPRESAEEGSSFRRSSTTQRAFTVCVGCPSFGGQRTVVVLLRKQVTRMSKPHGHATCTQRWRASQPQALHGLHSSAKGQIPNAQPNVLPFIGGETLLSSKHAKPAVMGPSTMRGIATKQAVWPNPSVKPTCSGLRPPHAAYLKRWASQEPRPARPRC